jgi:hypothetical protein
MWGYQMYKRLPSTTHGDVKVVGDQYNTNHFVNREEEEEEEEGEEEEEE